MSNHLAIAAVTATLKRVLQETLNVDVPGATVTMGRPVPATEDTPTSVNLYLYQVTPNSAFRGVDLPTRRNGQLVQRPQLGLNLHYLLSFYGNEATLEPQIVLASTVRALHHQPVLTPEMIAQTRADPTFAFVADADLDASVESVKFSPTGLSFEEFSKLWSALFQIPYVLSVTYEGSVVLLHRNVVTRSSLPVRSTHVELRSAPAPRITALASRARPADPFLSERGIGSGDTLRIEGHGLQGYTSRILFGTVQAQADFASADALHVQIPASLRAGAQSLVIAVTPTGDATGDVLSEPVPFLLRPRVIQITIAGGIDVSVEPSIAAHQRVTLNLRETPSPSGRPPRSFAIEALPSPGPADRDVVSFSRTEVRAGTYLVSVDVDGATSELHFDARANRFDAPTSTIP